MRHIEWDMKQSHTFQHQSKCFDLLLKEETGKKASKPKEMMMLEDKINEVGRQVDESNNNLVKLAESITQHTFCIDKLTDNVELISHRNEDNMKRFFDEILTMKNQIKVFAQNQHELSLKQVETKNTSSQIKADILLLKNEHTKHIEALNLKFSSKIIELQYKLLTQT